MMASIAIANLFFPTENRVSYFIISSATSCLSASILLTNYDLNGFVFCLWKYRMLFTNDMWRSFRVTRFPTIINNILKDINRLNVENVIHEEEERVRITTNVLNVCVCIVYICISLDAYMCARVLNADI